jgi:TetR/AcrR family transcriptional regulator, tetracycline repressor protein
MYMATLTYTLYSCQAMATKTATEADKARLSKAAVVERGLALADAEGLDGLTIRRLAADLGVTPMALYWHFRSKEELLAGLADQIWSEIDTDLDSSADWVDQLRALLESLVQVLRRHPSAAQLLIGGEKRNSEAALRASEAALAVLHRGGFSAETASAITRNALWTGLALAMSEPGFEPGMTEPERSEHMRVNRIRLAMLPPAVYPRLVEAAVPMTDCENPDEHYRFGVELFIAGVRAIAPGRKRD